MANIEIKTESIWEIEKKVNKRGGITIPVAIRRSIDIEGGDKFRVHSLPCGDLYLEKMTGRCAICGNAAYYQTAGGRFLCDPCRKEMEEESEWKKEAENREKQEGVEEDEICSHF